MKKIVILALLMQACQVLSDNRQRRALECRFASIELEDDMRDLRKAMLSGTVKYVQLDRVELAIFNVRRCVDEFTME